MGLHAADGEVEQIGDLGRFEPGRGEQRRALERPDFLDQPRLVPFRLLSDAVVRQPEGALLLFGEAGGDVNRGFGVAQQLGGREARVAGEDDGILVHDNDLLPAEVAD